MLTRIPCQMLCIVSVHCLQSYNTKTFLIMNCRKDTSVLRLVDLLMVSAMGPPGGGRNTITPRFLRHFNIITLDSFDEKTMNSIFSPIMDWHFDQGFQTSLKRFSRVRTDRQICVSYLVGCAYIHTGLESTRQWASSFIFE